MCGECPDLLYALRRADRSQYAASEAFRFGPDFFLKF